MEENVELDVCEEGSTVSDINSNSSRENSIVSDTNSNSSRENSDCCSICLCPFVDKAFVDSCYHSYCFECILLWAKVSRSCPLCKIPFELLVHEIYEDSFSKFHLPPLPLNAPNQRERRPARRQRNWGLSAAERQEARELVRRRSIYQQKLRAKHVKATTSSKCPDLSPSYLKSNPEKLNSLVPWIRRDLISLFPNSQIELIKDYIVGLMQRHHIQSDICHEVLNEYLGEHTSLFIHELVCFAKSSFDISNYDRYVQYE